MGLRKLFTAGMVLASLVGCREIKKEKPLPPNGGYWGEGGSQIVPRDISDHNIPDYLPPKDGELSHVYQARWKRRIKFKQLMKYASRIFKESHSNVNDHLSSQELTDLILKLGWKLPESLSLDNPNDILKIGLYGEIPNENLDFALTKYQKELGK